MRLIIVTRYSDGAKIYINPNNVCFIMPHYETKTTCIQFIGDYNIDLEVVESADTVARMMEDEACD